MQPAKAFYSARFSRRQQTSDLYSVLGKCTPSDGLIELLLITQPKSLVLKTKAAIGPWNITFYKTVDLRFIPQGYLIFLPMTS